MTTALSVLATRRRRLRILFPAGVAVIGLMITAVLGTVMAITGASTTCLSGGTGTGSGPAGPTPTRTALQVIPRARLRIYELAGRRFDIDWTFLASIGTQECDNRECAGDNGSGCAGPMQIAYRPHTPCNPGAGPTLWDRYQVSATGGTPDINDPADAVLTAARILRRAKGAPATGGSYHGYFQAACRYYGACASYATQVMARAVQFGFHSHDGQPPAEPASVSDGGACGQPTGGGPVSASRIVQVAQTQLGQREHPMGSNCTKYGPCEVWCALFVAWVWQHAGVPMSGGTGPYAYSGTIGTWTQAHGGRLLPPSARPRPGDAVLYGTGPRDSAHVGLVERVFSDGEILTIEGNFANQVARNGPFQPRQAMQAGEPAPIYAYAQPPGPAGARNA